MRGTWCRVLAVLLVGCGEDGASASGDTRADSTTGSTDVGPSSSSSASSADPSSDGPTSEDASASGTPTGSSTGEGSSGSSSPTSGSTTDDESSSSSSSTGGVASPYDPTCGDWTRTKVRAKGLDTVWTDGVDIIAGGDYDLVHRGAAWSEHTEYEFDDWALMSIHAVWGPAVDDHWFINAAGNPGVYRFDGTHATLVADVAYPNSVHSLEGSDPENVWALGHRSCDTKPCFENPECACLTDPYLSLHFDGIAWSEVEVPVPLRGLWTNGAHTWGVGNAAEGGGSILYFDGTTWSVEIEGAVAPLRDVWSADGDEVWAGGDGGALLHRVGGVWSDVALPIGDAIVRIDGRATDAIWALTDTGDLWAYDGSAWSSLIALPQARDFAVLEDGLVAVGEDGGHWVAHVDTDLPAATTIYRRDDFPMQTMLADDLDTAIASDYVAGTSWRWDGAEWTPTLEDTGVGFNAFVGTVDDGWGVRMQLNDDPESPSAAVWRIEDGTATPIEDPDDGLLSEPHPLLVDGVLWVAVSDVLRAYEDGAWVDHTPDYADLESIQSPSYAGGRLFTLLRHVGYSGVRYYEDGAWTQIGIPPAIWHRYAFATGPEDVWLTAGHPGTFANAIYHWDGSVWSAAADIWPEVAAAERWWHVAGAGDGTVWVRSSEHSQEHDLLAYWDGSDLLVVTTPAKHFVILDTPEAPAPTSAGDGLFLHDGIHVWRYAFCPAEP